MDQRQTSGQTGTQEPVPERRHRSAHWWIVFPVLAVALAAILSFLPPDPAVVQHAPGPTLSAVAAPAPASSPESPAPGSSRAAVTDPAASRPTGLVFPAAGMDMTVLPLAPSEADLASQSLVPPLTIDAYWLTSYGTPGTGSGNTTYIVGHSWDGRDAPFNRLSDTTLVGREFTLTTETGSLTYVVDSVTTHEKNTLKDSDIWNIVPNRVVLISCYTEDPWGKNVVVTATPKTA